MTRVLVVDDTATDRCLLEGLLRKRGLTEIRTATNGAEAIQSLDATRGNFDVVITDLHMPKLNGLELTTHVHMNFPWLPVVLITAHGSEELALRALEQGAASYVPKAKLASKLVETVEQVVHVAAMGRQRERFARSMVRADLEFVLETDESLFRPLLEMVQQMLGALDFCPPSDEIRMIMALEEALRWAARENRDVNGNSSRIAPAGQHRPPVHDRFDDGPLEGRRIPVRIELKVHEARFTVRHEGSAKARGNYVSVQETSAAGFEENRDLILMRSFMDEVLVAADGNDITLVKRRSLSQASA